jgi:HAE1 family hydrophobic/amphiphilic exporter-1
LARASIVTDRPVAITMFVVALAVFGFVSLSKLRVDLMPEISYPTLTVRTTWPGSAPEDVEQRISEKVQESVSTLDDLVRSTSISRAGISDVVLDFDWGTPMSFAVQDVREKLDGVFLPNGAERPLILRYDPNLDPVLRIGVRAPRAGEDQGARDDRTGEERTAELIRLRYVAENRLKRELEALEGVAAVQVRGGLIEEIRVRVDPYKLAAQGIDPGDIGTRLAQENINASGGSLLEGSTEFLVRTLNEFVTVDEIGELPVARRGDATVRIRDVADVERTYAKREVKSRIAGGEAVEIAIYREADANVVAVAERVKAKVFGTPQQIEAAEEIEKGKAGGPGAAGRGTTFGERGDLDFLAWRLRKEAALSLLSDQSTFISSAIRDVRDAALVGALLSIAVILLFLRRLSATMIIGVAIPISIVVTFAPMFMAGVSLNIMSLGGLALGVGMLVDNAIVVLESITRCREEGDDLKTAAVRGTSEVVGAVTASTLTTIAVFAPIVFVTGIAGQIFGDQALTVVTSLLVSLLVAVMFIPMLASRKFFILLPKPVGAIAILGPGDESGSPPSRPPGLSSGLEWRLANLIPNVLTLAGRLLLLALGAVVRAVAGLCMGLFKALDAVLRPTIGRAFQAGWGVLERGYPPVLRAAVRHPWAVVLASAGLFAGAGLRVGHLGAELLPEIHQGEFTAFIKLGVGTTLDETDLVLSRIDAEIRRVPGVESTALTVGVEAETLTREIEGSHTGRISVRLAPDASSAEREMDIEDRVRAIIGSDPAAQPPKIERPTPFALESPIAVEVRGYDLAELGRVSREVERRMKALDSLADVRTTLRPGHPEARVTFDREKTLELGLDLSAVSNLVRNTVLGSVSTRFNEGDERIDVRVIGDEAVLATLQDVLDLPVNPSAPNPVPLRAVASVREVQGPAEIRRIKNTRAIVISATAKGLDLGGVAGKIEAALLTMDMPDEVTVELGGQKREMDEAQRSMRFALFLAVFLVYVVMASQFESLVQPLVILLTVPLAGVGVVFALDLLDIRLSVVVFIGLIMLAGIVVNNAIVLVDRINQMRRRGLPIEEAVLEAGRARLRPILMTTATTVLGLLPLTGWLAGIPVVGALGSGEGAELRAPMAVAVIAGLAFSTLLTLVVIPTAYTVLARIGGRRIETA